MGKREYAEAKKPYHLPQSLYKYETPNFSKPYSNEIGKSHEIR
jgi:hypothetical protein